MGMIILKKKMKMIKVIIAGGRDLVVAPEHIDFIDKKLNLTDDKIGNYQFVTGMANGADQIPYFYERLGYSIKEFPANWIRYGDGAGHKRNKQMAEYADMLIAFWNGHSRGTGNMIRIAGVYDLKIIKELY